MGKGISAGRVKTFRFVKIVALQVFLYISYIFGK